MFHVLDDDKLAMVLMCKTLYGTDNADGVMVWETKKQAHSLWLGIKFKGITEVLHSQQKNLVDNNAFTIFLKKKRIFLVVLHFSRT